MLLRSIASSSAFAILSVLTGCSDGALGSQLPSEDTDGWNVPAKTNQVEQNADSKPRTDAPADTATLPTGPAESPIACRAKTCEDYANACGPHDNGCSGTVTCGVCVAATACVPKTCKDLGKACGTAPDGCDGTTNCGLCPTAGCTDAQEPNNNKETSTDLGEVSDLAKTTKSVNSITLSDGDEDWFSLRVKDEGLNGNPQIDASVGSTNLEVSVLYACTTKPDYSACTNNEGIPSQELGQGCVGVAKASVSTECKGTNESGTAYIRVRKVISDGQCRTYSLKVDVQ